MGQPDRTVAALGEVRTAGAWLVQPISAQAMTAAIVAAARATAGRAAARHEPSCTSAAMPLGGAAC